MIFDNQSQVAETLRIVAPVPHTRSTHPRAPSDRALKAYAVQEEDELTGGIVFAKSNAHARRLGANEFSDGDWHGVMCRRVRWADEFCPGPVPFQAMFDQGWWRECDGCGVRMEEGACDDDGNCIEFDIVEEAGRVFCAPTCRDRHESESRKIKRAEARAIAVLSARLLRSVPGVTVISGDQGDRYARPHAYVSRDAAGRLRIRQAVVHFDFPGRRHGFGAYRAERDQSSVDRRPTLFVPFGDVKAFKCWRLAGSVRLTQLQRQLLTAWRGTNEEFGCLSFRTIARRSGVQRDLVRRVTRALARKGLAQFHRGLWTDGGEPAGSGYGLTALGSAALDLIDLEEIRHAV